MAGILGALGGFSNPYGAPSKDEWAINSAKFKLLDGTNREIVFFATKVSEDKDGAKTGLESLSDGGGRRLAVYEYPYRDGQVVEDLGRKGEKFSFMLTFFGQGYRARYLEFYDKVIRQRTMGTLTHPSIGDVPARLLDYEFGHRHDQFNAVSLRCTFIEDSTNNTRKNQPANDKIGAIDSFLRGALSTITKVQSTVQQSIFAVQSLMLLPGAIVAGLQQRLASVISGHSLLLGKLAATFASDGSIVNLATSSGGITGANSGVSSTTGKVLPPVFQVGLSADETAAVESHNAAYTQASQVTATQLVYLTNNARAVVAEAIAYSEANLGSEAFDSMMAYRELVVSFQKAAEACLKSASVQTIQYLIPYDMTLMEAAFLNQLDPDRMIDIERLNPGLESSNFVPVGTVLLVPAA